MDESIVSELLRSDVFSIMASINGQFCEALEDLLELTQWITDIYSPYRTTNNMLRFNKHFLRNFGLAWLQMARQN